MHINEKYAKLKSMKVKIVGLRLEQKRTRLNMVKYIDISISILIVVRAEIMSRIMVG